MRKEVGLLALVFVLLISLVFADTILFAAQSRAVDYKGSMKTSINYQIDPGMTLTVKGNVEVDGEKHFFDFVMLEVLDGYTAQAYVKDYSDSTKGTSGAWKEDGSPVKNNDQYFANIYIYGSYIASESEQEWDGIFFYDYYVTNKGTLKYEDVKKDFLARLSESAVGELKAVLSVDKKDGDKPLAVKFDISKSTASTAKELENYELDFGDGSAKKTGVWPTDAAGLDALKSIAHTYNKSSAAKLTVWEKDTGKTSVVEVAISIKGEPTAVTCKSVLSCLASLDNAFVKGVFK